MKKDYNSKKKATIVALSLVAVCLVVGLVYVMGTMNNEPPALPVESKPPVETEIVVPEIKPESTPSTEAPTVSETQPETSSQPTTTTPPTSGDVAAKPSEGKPKSPSVATPPAEKPKETDKQAPVENPDDNGNCQPEQKPQQEQNQPQGGEKEDGKIYVPGFGWIEDEGGGSNVHEAPNAGTGDQIGDM